MREQDGVSPRPEGSSSSDRTTCVAPYDRPLIVLCAMSGHSVELAVHSELRVEFVLQKLVLRTGLALPDQLPVFQGWKLDPKRTLGSYNLPVADPSLAAKYPVFLYSKPFLRRDSPPPPFECLPHVAIQVSPASLARQQHRLYQASSPTARKFPELELELLQHSMEGRAIERAAQERLNLSRKFLEEQAVQVQALEAARGAAKTQFEITHAAHHGFRNKYLAQYQEHGDRLASFTSDLAALEATELHHQLKTPEWRTLHDLAPVAQLREVAEKCRETRTHFAQKVSELNHLFASLESGVHELMALEGWASVNAMRRDLAEAEATAQEELGSMMQVLSANLKIVQSVVDDVDKQAAAGALCEANAQLSLMAISDIRSNHEELLRRMREVDKSTQSFLERCVTAKNRTTVNLVDQLQQISIQQSAIRHVKSVLPVFMAALNQQKLAFSDLTTVTRLPAAYRLCLSECVRRKAWCQLFTAQAEKMVQHLEKVRSSEVAKQERFRGEVERYIPVDLLSRAGLLKAPPHAQLSVPPLTGLLPIELHELQNSHISVGAPAELASVDTSLAADEGSHTRRLEIENARLRATLASHAADIYQRELGVNASPQTQGKRSLGGAGYTCTRLSPSAPHVGSSKTRIASPQSGAQGGGPLGGASPKPGASGGGLAMSAGPQAGAFDDALLGGASPQSDTRFGGLAVSASPQSGACGVGPSASTRPSCVPHSSALVRVISSRSSVGSLKADSPTSLSRSDSTGLSPWLSTSPDLGCSPASQLGLEATGPQSAAATTTTTKAAATTTTTTTTTTTGATTTVAAKAATPLGQGCHKSLAKTTQAEPQAVAALETGTELKEQHLVKVEQENDALRARAANLAELETKVANMQTLQKHEQKQEHGQEQKQLGQQQKQQQKKQQQQEQQQRQSQKEKPWGTPRAPLSSSAAATTMLSTTSPLLPSTAVTESASAHMAAPASTAAALQPAAVPPPTAALQPAIPLPPLMTPSSPTSTGALSAPALAASHAHGSCCAHSTATPAASAFHGSIQIESSLWAICLDNSTMENSTMLPCPPAWPRVEAGSSRREGLTAQQPAGTGSSRREGLTAHQPPGAGSGSIQSPSHELGIEAGKHLQSPSLDHWAICSQDLPTTSPHEGATGCNTPTPSPHVGTTSSKDTPTPSPDVGMTGSKDALTSPQEDGTNQLHSTPAQAQDSKDPQEAVGSAFVMSSCPQAQDSEDPQEGTASGFILPRNPQAQDSMDPQGATASGLSLPSNPRTQDFNKPLEARANVSNPPSASQAQDYTDPQQGTASGLSLPSASQAQESNIVVEASVTSFILPSHASSSSSPSPGSQILPSHASSLPSHRSQILPSLASSCSPTPSSQILPSTASSFSPCYGSQILPSTASSSSPVLRSQIQAHLKAIFRSEIRSQQMAASMQIERLNEAKRCSGLSSSTPGLLCSTLSGVLRGEDTDDAGVQSHAGHDGQVGVHSHTGHDGQVGVYSHTGRDGQVGVQSNTGHDGQVGVQSHTDDDGLASPGDDVRMGV